MSGGQGAGIPDVVRRRIREALEEDIGTGDRTTEWCVPKETRARATIVARRAGVIFGLEAASEVFDALGGAELEPGVEEGASVREDDIVARVTGDARPILTGERVALNFLMHLSGVATLTRRFVEAVAGTDTRITDTRKTTPLWRELERRATRAGGAVNHRFGLYDMVLIKDNHLECAGGIAGAVRRARSADDSGLTIEVEVTDLEGVAAALEAGADRILLDNMPVEAVRRAVKLVRRQAPDVAVEASGGVTLETVGELAKAGVDYISVGALTHSAPALDMSLRLRTVTR